MNFLHRNRSLSLSTIYAHCLSECHIYVLGFTFGLVQAGVCVSANTRKEVKMLSPPESSAYRFDFTSCGALVWRFVCFVVMDCGLKHCMNTLLFSVYEISPREIRFEFNLHNCTYRLSFAFRHAHQHQHHHRCAPVLGIICSITGGLASTSNSIACKQKLCATGQSTGRCSEILSFFFFSRISQSFDTVRAASVKLWHLHFRFHFVCVTMFVFCKLYSCCCCCCCLYLPPPFATAATPCWYYI